MLEPTMPIQLCEAGSQWQWREGIQRLGGSRVQAPAAHGAFKFRGDADSERSPCDDVRKGFDRLMGQLRACER